MNNFDTAKMTDHATDYYFFLADKLACRQDNLFRTYLWVASMLITLHGLVIKEVPLKLYTRSMNCAIATLCLLVVTLAVCVWAMRGKQSVRHPNILAYAQQDASAEQLWTPETLLTDFWDVILREEVDRTKRGLRLRDISLCLTASIFMSALTAIVILCEGG